jgi:hypothetical protein
MGHQDVLIHSASVPDFPNAANMPSVAGSVLTYYPNYPTDSVASTVTLSGNGPSTVSSSNQTYDALNFPSGVVIANGVTNTLFTRCAFGGQVFTGDGEAGNATNTSFRDCYIYANAYSVGANDSPVGVGNSDFNLLRCNVLHAAHILATRYNHTIKDCWMHDMGGNTDAHKDGIYSGGGSNLTVDHCTFDVCDGPLHGVTAAIGLLTDFENQTTTVIKNCLLNACGSYTLYASGGPQKNFNTNNLQVLNNRFGTTYYDTGGSLGPVTYFDSGQAGMVWSGNVWHDGPNAGQTIPPVN